MSAAPVRTGPSDTMLSVKDIAEELGHVNPDVIARWCRAGRFRGALCLGGSIGWRIPRSSWERFKSEHRADTRDGTPATTETLDAEKEAAQ